MESRQGEIVMQDINENVFKSIIDYFYCGKIEIDDSNVQDLISISGLLQLRRIQEACCEFLKRQINTNNCLGMYLCPSLKYCLNGALLSHAHTHHTLKTHSDTDTPAHTARVSPRTP